LFAILIMSKQLDDAGQSNLTNVHLPVVDDTDMLHARLDVSGT